MPSSRCQGWPCNYGGPASSVAGGIQLRLLKGGLSRSVPYGDIDPLAARSCHALGSTSSTGTPTATSSPGSTLANGRPSDFRAASTRDRKSRAEVTATGALAGRRASSLVLHRAAVLYRPGPPISASPEIHCGEYAAK